VPVAAIHENHHGSASQDEIRTAGQSADVQAVAIAESRQDPSNDHLWRGVPATYPRHQLASVIWR
jgi:hypothetical protein